VVLTDAFVSAIIDVKTDTEETEVMVTMYFKLDEEKIRQSKYTKEQVEKIIRDFFKKQNGIEIAPLTFQRDDELAIGAFTNMFAIMMHDADFLSCLSECEWVINGEKENCLSELIDTMKTIKM
jgi:polysaccharide pyruvyl transferase WcaK-like protein